jgi:hypothetical protein
LDEYVQTSTTPNRTSPVEGQFEMLLVDVSVIDVAIFEIAFSIVAALFASGIRVDTDTRVPAGWMP